MRKLLIFIVSSATWLTAGCSSMSGITDAIPNALDRVPLVYRPQIVQGNVVNQELINQLEPGMTKRQVRFLLGSPMLSDVFHVDRWDYAYTSGEGSRPDEILHTTVYFENDRLVRITGHLRPQPEHERETKPKEVVVTVPDWEPEKKSLLGRAMQAVGVDYDVD
ncbi:MAG: outer membrane protein assembly factor BamE [Chromatiaceae bacterium]|nr:outer membrane protein assembly factor BamE [Chromatiaceae bacterium]